MKNAWFLAFACMAAALAGCNTSLQRNMPDAYASGPQDAMSALIESPAFLPAGRRALEDAHQDGGRRAAGLQPSLFSMGATQRNEASRGASEASSNVGAEGSEVRRVLQLSRVHALTAYDVLAGGAAKTGVFVVPEPKVETFANFAANQEGTRTTASRQ
jgi:hypothetical protein